ncbi:hypothetical protein ACVWZR_007744 [Bradyrhizobium sp. i1.3.1]
MLIWIVCGVGVTAAVLGALVLWFRHVTHDVDAEY